MISIRNWTKSRVEMRVSIVQARRVRRRGADDRSRWNLTSAARVEGRGTTQVLHTARHPQSFIPIPTTERRGREACYPDLLRRG